MGRIEHWHNPQAPKPNTLIPASNLLVVNDRGEILLQRRRDTGQWAIPSGAQEIGETPTECAIRECREETGIDAEVTGFLGVYSDPAHVVEYTDGEIRQEYEVTMIGRPIRGAPAANDEASDVRWVQPHDLDMLDIHPTIQRQIDHYLRNEYPHID
jgi:8-oxo-dGTP pyrophosphatase MutT (NUDIX family)